MSDQANSLPMLLNQTAAARALGLSRRSLRRHCCAHALFRPSVTGIPGRTSPTHYHRQQIELIVAVLAGVFDADTAMLHWGIFRQGLGSGAAAAPAETSRRKRRA